MRYYALAFALVFISACVQALPIQFEHGGGVCTEKEIREASIAARDGTISFSGFAITSPCNALSANATLSDGLLNITINTIRHSGACIQCVGEVPFNGSLMLGKGNYSAVLYIDGKIAAEGAVSIERYSEPNK